MEPVNEKPVGTWRDGRFQKVAKIVLGVGMGICLLSNLIWLPLTVRVIQNVIRYGYGANETKIGLAFPYLWAIHFFYFLLLSLPLGFSSFGILNKGKPLYFSIPVWILSVLYLAQFVIQCVILY